MSNIEDPWDDNFEIDVDLWFRALLAMRSDKEYNEKMIQGVMQRAGLPREKAELVISELMRFLAKRTRVN